MEFLGLDEKDFIWRLMMLEELLFEDFSQIFWQKILLLTHPTATNYAYYKAYSTTIASKSLVFHIVPFRDC